MRRLKDSLWSELEERREGFLRGKERREKCAADWWTYPVSKQNHLGLVTLIGGFGLSSPFPVAEVRFCEILC